MIVWNSRVFIGSTVQINPFSVIISFISRHSSDLWNLTCVYGPCVGQERSNFVSWLKNLSIGVADKWLFLGDFSFYRSTENRNRPGAYMNDMLIFNEIISRLGLLEIPLKGRAFTWSNIQQSLLLERCKFKCLNLVLVINDKSNYMRLTFL